MAPCLVGSLALSSGLLELLLESPPVLALWSLLLLILSSPASAL